MSFVVAVPDLVQGAANDLAGIRASLAEATATVAAPTTGVMPAAADEVSAAIAAMFGNFGRDFQAISAQAQVFHAEFVSTMNAGAGAYLSTEVANAQLALTNAINSPVQTLFGGGVSTGVGTAASSRPASILGGLLGGSSGGTTSGILGGLTGSGGLLSGLSSLGGSLDSLGSGLTSILSGAVPGLPGLLTGVENSLTGIVNNLLPGLVQINVGNTDLVFTGIAGPYDELFYNTWNNLQALGSAFLADPFPFLRQFVANQIGYGQIIATALQNAAESVEANAAGLPAAFQAASQAFTAGNYAGGMGGLETALQYTFSGVGPALTPISAIPGHIAQNMTNVVQTLTNMAITPYLTLATSPAPLSATIDNVVGLPLVAGIDLLGAPVSALEAAGSSASAFMSAMQAGNTAGAIAALIDAPAVIANGFLNGQATFPFALSLAGLTAPLGLNLNDVASISVVANFPLDGILVPPGYYPVTVSLDLLNGALSGLGAGPITLNAGVGGTPFSGLLPFLINYAPEQLAIAIGAPASPPPLISLPL